MNPSCLNRKIEVKNFTFKKKGERVFAPNPCGTTATLVVKEGEMQVNVQGQTVMLTAGQVLEFRAAREHSFVQGTKNYAKGILITSFG